MRRKGVAYAKSIAHNGVSQEFHSSKGISLKKLYIAPIIPQTDGTQNYKPTLNTVTRTLLVSMANNNKGLKKQYVFT
jgi:hypothetical protein